MIRSTSHARRKTGKGSPHRLSTRSTNPAGEPLVEGWPPTWCLAGLLVLLVVLAYANSLAAPFVYDDQRSIVQNQQIRRLWPLSVPLSPPDETPVARRPLVNLSFAVNYALGGLEVTGYHLASIAVHALAGLVLFGIVRRTIALQRAKEWDLGQYARSLAWWCAALWLLHPLQTDAVTYTTQRTESMMGVFHFLTLYCAVRAAQSARPGRWQAGAIAACGLGMACKESMATAPIIVAAYDRTFLFGSWRQAFRARGLLYAGLAITWVELGLLMASGERTSVQLSGFTESWTYLLNQLQMISRYVGLAFWPRSLVFDYGVPVQVSLSDVRLAGLVVTCLAVATLAALWFRPWLGFLGVWFFVTLAPTSSVIPIATEVGAERRMYLPLAAVVVLVVAGTYAGAVAASRKKWTARQWAAAAATGLAVVAALLGLRTAARNREYSSLLVLAQTTVERYPHGRSYFFLGSELLREGRRDEGLHYLERSAVDFPGARFAIGVTYLEQQRLDAGIEQLEEYLRLLPAHINVPHARDMLAGAYLEQGKLDQAAHHYTERLKLAPIDFGPLERLGDIAVRQNKLPEAIARYQAFLLQTPGSTSAHNSLGAALATLGRMPEAVQSFRRAVELDPRNRDAWLNLARAQIETGEPTRGVEAARRAVALAPGHAVSYEVLGTALGLSGDLDAAIAAFKSAIALDPTDARARDGLALAGRIKAQQSR